MRKPSKRVLFLNPAKSDSFPVTQVHMGLTLIGEILVSKGHEVKVIDYAYLDSVKEMLNVPTIREVITEFNPDVIGISVFSYLYDEVSNLINEVSMYSSSPIILGGPHFSIFPDDFSNDERISYIVKGEAENVISDIINNAKQTKDRPVFIAAPIPSANEIPEENLDIVYGNQFLYHYQIQLSRGCPYMCTFCNIRDVAGYKFRTRDIEICLKQIEQAKKKYPTIRYITITDDCPTLDIKRFKKFLKLLIDKKLDCILRIDNLRANLIDEELIKLYVKAGGSNICLGIESGHPEVFKDVQKGETIEDIINAAKLVKKYGLTLGGCFVIGLPGDTPERHRYTMEFAKSLKLDYSFWNMVLPWPGTKIREWYEKNGVIGELRKFSTLIDPNGQFQEPPAYSTFFPKKELIRAWLMANMERKDYFANPFIVFKLLYLTFKFNLFRSFVVYITHCFIPSIFKLIKQTLKVARMFAGGIKLLIGALFYRLMADKNLPGKDFDRFGRKLSKQFILKRDYKNFLQLACCPVSSVRYFEFPFVYESVNWNRVNSFLDVSSPSFFYIYLISKFPHLKINIINPDLNDLKTTEYYLKTLKLNNDISLNPYNALSLPYEKNTFDVITSISVIEHVPAEGDSQVIKELWRVLRPGGKLVLTFPCSKEYQEEWRDWDEYGINHINNEGKYFFQRLYDMNAIKNRLIKPAGVTPYVMTFFGEKVKGNFDSYTQRWLKYGLKETLKDPYFISKEFEFFESVDSLPGMGICGLLFEKPKLF